MNTDDKIRAILRIEADAVDPSPAGWDAIQHGIATRRSRAWWTRGAVLAGTAAAVVGIVVFAAADRTQRGIEGTPTTHGPSASAAPSPSTSPSPVATNDPIGAIWPLTTTAEVAHWAADHATYPALETASSSALAFGRNYLGAKDATVVPLEGAYGENDFEIRRDGVAVSRVTVKGFGADGTAPFVVIRAESDAVRLDSPAGEAPLSGPFTARGSYEAADPAIDVYLRADTGGSAPVELRKVRATTTAAGWHADIAFTTTARTGSLLVTNASLKDGGIGAAAAIPVVFGEAQAVAGPDRMVAIRDGRVALLSTATGELVRWLTEAEPGGGAFAPELSEDGTTVVYAQGSGTCAAEIRSVPVAGGAPTTLATSTSSALSAPSRRGPVLAYVRTECDSTDTYVTVRSGTDEQATQVTEVWGGPVVGERFVAWVEGERSGTTLRLVDSAGAGSTVAAPAGCSWSAPAWGPADGGGRPRLSVVASCGPRNGAMETWLYRVDEDGRNLRRLARLDVTGVENADYAGSVLVLGVRQLRTDEPYVAYVYAGGTLHRVPGIASHPSWS